MSNDHGRLRGIASGNAGALVVIAAVFLITLFARLAYIRHFAVAMPFWDQWDGEGDHLLAPWIRGTLTIPQFLSPHNEHYILPTKILTLVSYSIFHQWNNLREAQLSALVFSTEISVIASIFLLQRPRIPTVLLPLSVLLAGALLPFDWENMLVGFQSQFYFLSLLSIISISMAAYRPDSPWAQFVSLVCGAMAALTMASGMLAPLASAFVYLSAWRLGILRADRAMPLILASLAIFALAFQLLPSVPQTAALKANSPLAFIDSLDHTLSFPVLGFHWGAFWLWLPTALALTALARRSTFTRTDLAMLGLAAWTGLQALSIVYARGNGLLDLPSRYTHLLMVGTVANAWLCIRISSFFELPRRFRLFAWVPACAFLGTFAFGHYDRLAADTQALKDRRDQERVQWTNTRAYLEDGDFRHLQQPFFQIPYPSAERLRSLLDDPAIRKSEPGGFSKNRNQDSR